MMSLEIPKIKMTKISKKIVAVMTACVLAAPIAASGATLTAVFYTHSGNIRGVEARTTGASGFVRTNVRAANSVRSSSRSVTGTGSTPWVHAEIVHNSGNGTLVREAWTTNR